MGNGGSNQIKVYRDLTIFYGYGLSKKIHTNHCAKLIIAEEPFSVSHGHQTIEATGAIIRSDVSHSVRSEGGLNISIYIDPESDIGKEINDIFKKDKILKLKDEVVKDLLLFFRYPLESHFTELEVKNVLIKTLLNRDTLQEEHKTIDERIQSVITHIKSSENYSISFAELLSICSLSESRLIHLFKKETGITIRRYILWCRLQKSLRAMASGSSIKQSAQLAGFTDAAHLNRTFVSMYGVNPSSMLK
jgi:AraC-like DNA-binding protein